MATVKTVFFDLDGTLWSPATVALAAYADVFRDLEVPLPDDATLLATLGYATSEIWRQLLPAAPLSLRRRAAALMEKRELARLKAGNMPTFPSVKETLTALKEAGLTLVVLSNCDVTYLSEVPDALGIGRLFDNRFCAAAYPGLTKAEILEQILPGFPRPAAMVGDRWHDMEAGRSNGLLTVGCSFGIGTSNEFALAHHVVKQFSDLAELLLTVPAP